LFIPIGTASAQDNAKPTTEKWRPKDGLYGDPKRDSEEQCPEASTLTIEFAEKSVNGYEWGCKINKLTDAAPGAIKLDMTCYDYNLAESLYPRDPKAEKKRFKEVMLLKRIDDGTISVRKTLNGKFKYPSWRADYCPEDVQRTYFEEKARDKAQAEQKAADEHPWRPQAGIYAIPGTNFDDRCLKSGDTIIELAERSISTGADTCNVTFIRNEPNALQLFVTCDAASNARDAVGSHAEGRSPPAPSRPETIILKKIDDKTVFLQTTKDRKFVDAGGQLAYCGKEAQKAYEQHKAKK
jgi:hypothetical protein